MMIVILGDFKEDFVGEGKIFENIGDEFFNAALHSIQIVIIWIRLLSVLILFR
jgi:hypothetical protein